MPDRRIYSALFWGYVVVMLAGLFAYGMYLTREDQREAIRRTDRLVHACASRGWTIYAGGLFESSKCVAPDGTFRAIPDLTNGEHAS